MKTDTENPAESMTRAEARYAAARIAYDAVLQARAELLVDYGYSEADRANVLFWLEDIVESLRRKLAAAGRL